MHKRRRKDDIRFCVWAMTHDREEIMLIAYAKSAFEAEHRIRTAYGGVKSVKVGKTISYEQYRREEAAQREIEERNNFIPSFPTYRSVGPRGLSIKHRPGTVRRAGVSRKSGSL